MTNSVKALFDVLEKIDKNRNVYRGDLSIQSMRETNENGLSYFTVRCKFIGDGPDQLTYDIVRHEFDELAKNEFENRGVVEYHTVKLDSSWIIDISWNLKPEECNDRSYLTVLAD